MLRDSDTFALQPGVRTDISSLNDFVRFD